MRRKLLPHYKRDHDDYFEIDALAFATSVYQLSQH